jgi:chaperone required for assembly of F1-ATPase
MSEWAAKRFWKDVCIVEKGDAFGVELDGRPLKTPAKTELLMPTQQLAVEVAAEWQAAKEVIDPQSMPWTRSANSAVDKIVKQRHDIEGHLIGYAETDLTCYRADGPTKLVERQAEAWDHLVEWASGTFGVSFNVTTGVMPVAQSPEMLARLRGLMSPMSAFELTGFHDLVTLSGSYVIALAVAAERDSVEALWAASRVDEDYQIQEWGADEEAFRSEWADVLLYPSPT